jgi:single-strand DNA-binding protein
MRCYELLSLTQNYEKSQARSLELSLLKFLPSAKNQPTQIHCFNWRLRRNGEDLSKGKIMSSSINKVILVGNLGANPEFRQFENGDKICTLSVATNSNWKDKVTKEWREITQWHRVVVRSSNLVKVCERRLSKGMKLYLEGMIESRKWTDATGQVKFLTEIVLRPYRSELQILQATSNQSLKPDFMASESIDVPF